MANSDKNIVITPNTGTSSYPSIAFTGSNASPITLKVLDTGALSFSATAGQLFTIQDGLTGSLFAVADISGIPLIEVMDTSIVKLNQYGGSSVIAGSVALQNSGGVNSKLSIYTNTATTTGLIVKAATSQTATLTEWQNSSGAAVTRISSDGTIAIHGPSNTNLISFVNSTGNYGVGGITSSGVVATNGAAFGYTYSQFGATVGIRPGISTTANIALVIRGETSQTGDLQQWQNSAGTVISKVDAGGIITATAIYASTLNAATVNLSSQVVTTYEGRFGGAPALGVVTAGTWTTSIPLFVARASSGQTASLQEWQNSAGTALAKIQADGSVGVNGTPGTNTKFYIEESYTGNGGANTGLRVRGTGSSSSNWKGRIIAGGDTVAFLMGEYNSQAWLGGHNAALNAWASFYINPDGLENVYLGNTGSAGSTPIVTIKNANGFVGIGTSSATAKLHIINTSASAQGLIVKGAASQTANVFEVQNSSGSAQVYVNAYGQLAAVASGMFVNPGYSSGVGITVRGYASQTANLQEWQNSSGTVLASISNTGNITLASGLGINMSGANAGIYGFGGEWGVYREGADFKINAPISLYLQSVYGGGTLFASMPTKITNSTAASVGLIVKAAASQTANLQEWQDSSGNILANLTSTGRLRVTAEVIGIGSYLAVGSNGGSTEAVYLGYNYDYNIGSGGIIFNRPVRPASTSAAGSVIRGLASQSGNLQEWQDSSGNVLAAIRSDGVLRVSQIISKENYSSYFSFASGSSIQVNPLTAGTVGLVVKGAASQTANLQEWQNSSGTLLSAIDKAGNLTKGDGDQLVLASQIFG